MKKLQQKPVSYFEAYELVISESRKINLPVETVALDKALNRALSEDLVADTDKPVTANSSMDGYCLRSSDIAGATIENPVKLPVVPGIDAGHPIENLPAKHCAYIATGAPIPDGADTVVRIEDVPEGYNTDLATFSKPVEVGNFIRAKGAEQIKGQKIASAGQSLSPFMIGIAASTGLTSVRVKRKPVVGILTSGDELVQPWDQMKPWQVRNANSLMLCAQAAEAGAIAIDHGIARDDEEHAKSTFMRALQTSDIVVTSGGISMGRKDPFRNVFEELEIDPIVYGVRIKPGKPFFFGYYKDKPVFALPGNQVSSAVSFELFVRPFIRSALNLPANRQKMVLPLKSDSHNSSKRDFFERGYLVSTPEGLMVEPIAKQDSHMLSGFAHTQVLYLHPFDIPLLKAGEKVDCILIRNETLNE